MSLKVGERDIIISFKLDNFLELTWKNQVRCLVCYKDFSKRSNAKRHVAAVHLREQSMQCQWCPQRFKHVSALRRHVVKSHGEGVVICPNKLCHWKSKDITA